MDRLTQCAAVAFVLSFNRLACPAAQPRASRPTSRLARSATGRGPRYA